MRKRLLALMAAAAVLLAHGIIIAAASVYTTADPTNGECVYIAGNPDLYPLEYYDRKDKEYKGILPDLYKQISEESGIDFSYVSAGTENEQDRMSKNKQVELVSAHIKGEVDGLTREVHILTLDNDGQKLDVCIGFTTIASDEVVSIVSDGIGSVSAESILRIAVENSSPTDSSDYNLLMIFAAGELVVLVVLLVLGIIRRRSIEKQAAETTFLDTMTGIGNSFYYDYRYQKVITPESSTLFYVAYIGVDVKYIVQYYDAALSEEMQIYAASELTEGAGENDFCARISDGRFAAAFEAPSIDAAQDRLRDLLARLNRFDRDLTVRFRAGLYHLESHSVSGMQALYNARQGYYRACEEDEAFVLSDRNLLKHDEYVLGLKKKLRTAIENRQFRLYTQYIFTSDGQTVCAAEALSRWDSPENGTVFPGEYIEMLESAGMIGDLDYYMLEECCRTLSEWKNDDKKNLWLSCNVNKNTLAEEDFMERFSAIIDRYSFNPANFVIEISEDALAEKSAQIIENIEQCKSLGCRIALDDYGLGNSTFNDLVYYPIDMVKVCRQIVERSKTDRGARLLGRMIRFAHFVGIKALCQGIEDEEEFESCIKAECDYVQGFMLSHALPADEASGDRGISFIGESDE